MKPVDKNENSCYYLFVVLENSE